MWLKLCGGAVLCVVAILLIKGVRGDAMPLQWTGMIVLLGATLLLWQPILSWVGELCEVSGVGERSALLLKGLGVSVLTQLCADLCKQSGEAQLASSVEGAGKAELLVLCLPLLRELVQTAQQLLGGG